ncbi:MAG: hypothetical protein V4574_04155 [Pseudomonadota bacterium]
MPEPASPWRPAFLAALRLLAKVSDAMAARGLPRPVLVGGGAVEFYTGSALMTGDIDVTSPVQIELEAELEKLGFIRPIGPGHSHGWVHPELALTFEVVASTPFDGTFDSARIRMIRPAGSEGEFRVVSIEDMIADRMGQHASGSARDMLEQAQLLLALYPNVDLTYLEQRIRAETAGDHGVDDIQG